MQATDYDQDLCPDYGALPGRTMQATDYDQDLCPDYGALPDDLSEFMNDSYLVNMLDADGLFADDPMLIFDGDDLDDTPLTKELPGQHGNQQVDQIKPKGKNNILQKRPRATLSKRSTKKQKAEGSDTGSMPSQGDLSCLSTAPQSILHLQSSIQFVTFPAATSYQLKMQTTRPPVGRLPYPVAAAPTCILVHVSPSPSVSKLQVPPFSPEDSAVVPAQMSSPPSGTLSDTTSKVICPPCDYEMTQRNASNTVQQSPTTFDLPESVKNYIRIAKAQMHQICEEMEPRLNLSSHYVDVQVIQRESFCSGKKKNKCPNKDLLAMGDTDRQKRRIKLNQIFEKSTGDKPKRHILLLGKAGMGKTTLIRKLCHDWSRDGLPQFDFVFLLDGKDLISSRKSCCGLQTLLLDHATVATSVINTEEVYAQVLASPKRVLIIFDGFDSRDYDILFQEKNLTALFERETKAKSFTVRQLYSAILQRVLLPGCFLLISARPKGTTACPLAQRMDCLLEAHGFTLPNIEAYFSRYFADPDLRDSALKCFEKSSYLRHLCWNPGICRLVCLVLEHTEGSEGLPRTLTELCHQVLCIKIKNDNRGRCPWAESQGSRRAQVKKRTGQSRGKDPIETDEIKTAHGEIGEKEMLSRLSSLAWEGVKANVSVLPQEASSCSKLKTFGLGKGFFRAHHATAGQLGSCCERKEREGEVERLFESENAEQRQHRRRTHIEENVSDDDVLMWMDPFLQSYLAGLHLSTARNVWSQYFLQNLLSQPGLKGRRRPQGEVQELTRRFAFGILFLKPTELRKLHLDINSGKRALFTERFEGLSLADLGPDQVLEVCHYAFEASFSYDNGGGDGGEAPLVTHLAENLPEVLTFRGVPLGPLDAYVVQKILERAENGGRTFSLDLENTGIPIPGLRSLVGLGSCTTYRACIADVIALWEQLEQSGERKPLQHFVTKFKIHPMKVMQVRQIEHLAKLVNIHTHGRLSDCLGELDAILENGVPAVKELRKLEFEIGPERGPQAIPKLWEFLPNLHDLQHLDLEGNKIGDNGAEQLANHFASLCFLQILNLSQNYIGDDGVKKMATALKDLPKLHCLILYSNVICDEGAATLAAVLPHMASLTDLDVKYNKLSDVGAQCLGASLRKCQKMKTLRMWNQSIPYGIFERLQHQDPRILWH
ncbi:MHC class II transactivator isoform X2 [Hippocampus comes]|uniref:MHC class II transactivator isoform X2 n=1 Tax=Hippocampus comes TaxID=109280 RepID=UPI00094F31CD|nr:PREDICTED: MHC class II transactivator isoform X2 [Hippocampus comes]